MNPNRPRRPALEEHPAIVAAALALDPKRAHGGAWFAPNDDPYHLLAEDHPIFRHTRFVSEYRYLWEPNSQPVLIRLLNELRPEVPWDKVYRYACRRRWASQQQ